MVRPLALDLFCGAGGASMGLWRAGFDVIGVDIKPQPRYPFPFIRGDALNPPVNLERFDFVWASPPCQRFSLATRCRPTAAEKHPNLIEPVRTMLQAIGAQFVIENVPGAPLRRDFVLDGDMFGLGTYRKRIFEASFFALHPAINSPFGPETREGACTLAGGGGNRNSKPRHQKNGKTRSRNVGSAADWRRAISVDWMTRDELAQSIPPAYSEFIGRAALRYMGRLAA